MQIVCHWKKLGRGAVDPILTQQPVKLLPTLCNVLWCPKANMEMSGERFSFWLKGVFIDSLTSYTFCKGEWKVMQIPPETFCLSWICCTWDPMPHGSWGWAWACSIFGVKRTLRRSLLQELSCTESLWVWQLHFLLCAATCKENLLCLLMFILILHVFTTHRRKWQIEKIFVFTKAKRLLQQTARQTQC